MKSRRAISSVVGTAFLIAVVAGSLSYVSYGLNTMGNFSESLIAEESRQKDKQSEAFDVTSVKMTGGKLDGTIKNTGDVPIQLNTIWIDELDVNDVVQKFTISEVITPGNTVDIIDLVDFTMESTKAYEMKVVSSRGEAKSIYVNSAGSENLNIQLIAAPDTVPKGFTSTLIMTVVNNMTSNNRLVNLTPVLTTSCGIECELITDATPSSYESLDSGDIAIFKWVYQLNGDAESSESFIVSLLNGVSGNEASATVTVGTILESNLSGESLNSLGVGANQFATDVFIFHTENDAIPADSDYQMSLTIPDTTGTTIVFDDVSDDLKFISANATAEDVNIPAGIWNASLTYNSDRLPSGMAVGADNIWGDGDEGGHIFHFNTQQLVEIEDSVADANCYNLASSGSAGISGATWYATQGVNGSGAYRFDGTNDRIRIDDSNQDDECNRPNTNLFTMAGWFNATDQGAYDTRQVLWQKADTGDSDYFEIVIGDGTPGNRGVLFFNWHTEDSGNDNLISCDTSSNGYNYMDDEWHHFVATRYNSGGDDCSCRLYIDGSSTEIDSMIQTDCDDDKVKPRDDMYIGSNPSNTEEFTGMLDDLMFWNDYSLSGDDAAALKLADYGPTAHEMTFIINMALGNGVTASNIVTSENYELPFVDQMHFDNNDENNLWSGYNYTSPNISAQTMQSILTNRINFTMAYDAGMPLNLRIDESDMNGQSGNLLSSFLQPPAAAEQLPTYYIHDRDEKVEFFAYNSGDEGAWLTYQGSRIVFNGTNGNYAALIDTVDVGNGAEVLSATRDSPFIGPGVNADIVFWDVQTIPENKNPTGTSARIEAGYYDVTIFLNGYDEDGTLFLRSIPIGSVLVTE